MLVPYNIQPFFISKLTALRTLSFYFFPIHRIIFTNLLLFIYLLHDCGHVAEDSTDENSPKEVDLIKIENIAAREKETAILIPEVFNIYREKLTAIAITSDDMQPTISKNAIILCNDFGFVGSGIYAVKINGVYSVKRISLKNTESYIMACDNKLYETFEVAINDERLEIVGLVRVAINIL